MIQINLEIQQNQLQLNKIIINVEKDFDLKIDTSIIRELNSVKSIIRHIESDDKDVNGLKRFFLD